MAGAIIIVVALMLVIIVAKPKWGSFFIWIILYAYPHGWWFYKGFLPLNIGADDMFCILLFLIVFLKRNMLEGIPIRFGFSFWSITFFTIVSIVATFVGSRHAEPFYRILYYKDIMKFGVMWCLFYAIIHCIDNIKDIRKQFQIYSIASFVGAMIVILQYFFPSRMEAWTTPDILEAKVFEYAIRASGAFMNGNYAACILTCSVALMIASVSLHKSPISKILSYVFISTLLIGIMVTQSRGGIIALVGVLFCLAFFSNSKKVAWVIIITGIVFVISFATISEKIITRFSTLLGAEAGTLDANVYSRLTYWKSYFTTATPDTYLLGQGFRQGVARNHNETHNTYISLITVYGIGGVVWFIMTMLWYFKKVSYLKKVPNQLMVCIAHGCNCGLIGWLLFGVSGDGLGSHYARFMIFYLLVLIDRSFCIYNEQESLTDFYYEYESNEVDKNLLAMSSYTY